MPTMQCSHDGCANVLALPPESFVNGWYWCALHVGTVKEPEFVPVTCTEEGCEVTTRFLAGRGIRDGQWRCAAHGMSVILFCLIDGCTVAHEFQMGDNIPDGFFCPEHAAEENQKLVDHVRSIPCLPPKPDPTFDVSSEIQHGPDAKVIVQLTVDQINDLTEVLRIHHNNPTVGLRPAQPPYPTETIKALKLDIEKFHGMADIGMAALIKIHSDPNNEATELKGIKLVRWGEDIAKEAIDAMRKLRDV